MSSELSLTGFAALLASVPGRIEAEQHRALERAAKLVEAEAKRSIGHYQNAAGPFEAWARLAPATQADRVAQGYPADEPLLRDGHLRESIHHAVEGDKAVVGSDSEIAVYQELGTGRVPPRSFLGGAAVRKAEEVARILGGSVAGALVGREVYEGRMDISGD